MKVKDLIKSLKSHDPEKTIVMKNLYKSSHDPDYVMKKIRTYSWGGKIIIDGYDRVVMKNEN